MEIDTQQLSRLDHLTHRGNSKHSRYGWLRLTPAFSVHLIRDRVRSLPVGARVLDPFCGTGTTALVCAEEGVECDTADINEFLLWLGEAKCSSYSPTDLSDAWKISNKVLNAVRGQGAVTPWLPSLFQIYKWWPAAVLEKIGVAMSVVEESKRTISRPALNLLKIIFCRVMIESSNASFGHQSMSFKRVSDQLTLCVSDDFTEDVAAKWTAAAESILNAAESNLFSIPHFIKCDARELANKFERGMFDCVITSPPYPNRMSYIRELRPYMYWLGYLDDAKQAGELDWEAIGGTWGCATSNLTKWGRPRDLQIPYDGFEEILTKIASADAKSGPLLSKYVEKYFCDMVGHVTQLFDVVKVGGSVHYVVGNSKFYNVMLPVQEIFASLFNHAGFVNTSVETIRKRTSKKELFEYVVHATKGAN